MIEYTIDFFLKFVTNSDILKLLSRKYSLKKIRYFIVI